MEKDMQTLIAAAIGYLVTEGLKSLSALLGRDLSGSSAAISAALVTAFVLFAEAMLSAVPDSYQPIVRALMSLLVAVFGAFGIHRLKKSVN